jgi:hypothetical protein
LRNTMLCTSADIDRKYLRFNTIERRRIHRHRSASNLH